MDVVLYQRKISDTYYDMEECMNKEYENDEIEIDLREIFAILMDKLKWIVLVGIAGAVCAFLVTAFLITPKYQSDTSVYILSRQKEDATSYSDLQASAMLAEDCTAMVKSRAVTSRVIKQLSLKMTEDELIKCIDVKEASSSGRVITITVTHTSPELAQQIANAVREISSETFVEKMDVQAVNVVDEANYPEKAVNIRYKRNTALGLAGGVFISACLFVMLFLMNSKIRTQDDIEKYLGLSVLGVIPDSDEGKNTEEMVNSQRRSRSSSGNSGKKKTEHKTQRDSSGHRSAEPKQQ